MNDFNVQVYSWYSHNVQLYETWVTSITWFLQRYFQLLKIIAKYECSVSQWPLLTFIVEVLMNKIVLWISIGAIDWTAVAGSAKNNWLGWGHWRGPFRGSQWREGRSEESTQCDSGNDYDYSRGSFRRDVCKTIRSEDEVQIYLGD